MTKPLARRTILRGVGACIALPWLEAMHPSTVRASGSKTLKPPVRLVWLHTESGMWMPDFKPQSTGFQYELSPTLQPIQKYRDQLSVLSGLFHEHAFRRNPQTGRHVQDTMCHLTGADLSGTPGITVRNSISIDQFAAQHVGHQTRIPTLNLSPNRSGYLAYSASGSGIPNDWNPRDVFTKLFADPSPESKQKLARSFTEKKSILDTVMESATNVRQKASRNDRHRLDEFFSHIREVENRVHIAEEWSNQPVVTPPADAKQPPADPPNGDLKMHIRLLLDMLTLALQTDQTRLATMQMGFMSCRYPAEGLPESYHHYTHHDGIAERQAAMAKIDRIRIENLAYFLDRLSAIQEGEHSLLENSVIHYGSGMGSWHESTDIANILIGKGGGAIKSCGHTDFKAKPLSNLYLSMLKVASVPATNFSDGSAIIEDLLT